jgi:hypothetical protein
MKIAPNKCFIVLKQQLSHAECANQCGDGASLACIESEVENTFVMTNMLRSGITAWIGFYHRIGEEESGKWASGCESRFRNWHSDPYSGCGFIREDCVVMQSDGTWASWQCAALHHCVCQFPAQSSADYPPEFVKFPPLHEGNIWGASISFALVPVISVAVGAIVNFIMKRRNDQCSDGGKVLKKLQSFWTVMQEQDLSGKSEAEFR